MTTAIEREIMDEVGMAVLLEDVGSADLARTTDRSEATSHGDGGYTVLTRTYGGDPYSKMALNQLAGIAAQIAIGYPDGVDKGMRDLSKVDHRTVTLFQEALPYLDASRGDDYQGYSGIEHFSASKEVIAREQEITAKLKALNAAQKVVDDAVAKNLQPSQAALDKLKSLMLTPEELVEARAMEAEAHRQAAVRAKQCKNSYYLDLLDIMHIILTSGKSDMHNSLEGVEERAADAFVAKLRTNARLLALSLSPDASEYIEANEKGGVQKKNSATPRQKGKLYR